MRGNREIASPSPTPSHQGRGKSGAGFTLTEILIVMGLISMIAAFGLFISMDVYRGNSFRSEKNIIISVLQKARSRAVNNINEERHGVHFETGKYILFQVEAGDVYDPLDPNNEEIPTSNNVTNSGLNEIMFTQLTGEAIGVPPPLPGEPNKLSIAGQAFSETITINDEGRISW